MVIRIALNFSDQFRNALRRFLRLLRQLANFVRDYGKPASLLAGSGRLDGRIQRQQVRLPGNTGNNTDNLPDFFGTLAQFRHHLGRIIHGFFNRRHLRHRPAYGQIAFFGFPRCLRRVLRCLRGTCRRLLHAGRDMLHRTGRLSDRPHLFFRPLGHFINRLRYLGYYMR